MLGLYREQKWDVRTRQSARTGSLPKVSVLVPVRNEESRIAGLLHGLALQDYPDAEIIFINDRSSDRTAEILADFANTHCKAHIITLTENTGVNHKQYALSQGLTIARGELYLFTDADCEIPAGWIRALVARMGDQTTGVVIGPVFKKAGGRRFFYQYQCFDHAVRYMYLVGSTGLGAAGGGFGNNLAIRREALHAIGGYASVPVSPTEDAALVSRVRTHSRYRIHSATGADAAVMTLGESGWKALVNQTLRWNNGGLFSPDIGTRLNFTILMLMIAAGMVALPLSPFFPSLWLLSGAVLLAMSANTVAILRLFGSKLPAAGALWLLHTIFTPLYFTFLTLLGFCHVKVSWKK
jgi:cellulose synthase/poly-beta-1,6-N-acetylglucosamine synthase-like glycosyltransferase